MADGEVIVKTKIVADTSGAKQSEAHLDGLKSSAKQFGDETKRAGETVAQSFGRITKAAGLFRNVLTGFGVVGIFTTLANGIGTLIKSFK